MRLVWLVFAADLVAASIGYSWYIAPTVPTSLAVHSSTEYTGTELTGKSIIQCLSGC